MAFAFDSHRLGHVLDDVVRVVTGAREIERRLVALVNALEADAQSMLASTTGARIEGDGDLGVASLPVSGAPLNALESIRQICVEAREHRQHADALASRLFGDAVPTEEVSVRRRVLVVDDSQANVDVVTLVLEGAGFEAITARNGLDALIAAHYTRPAVILMDLAMPVLGGIDATRLLKSSSVTQGINVIAYTGERSLLDSSSLPLFADVMMKPANPDDILTSVRRFIGHGLSAEPSGRARFDA